MSPPSSATARCRCRDERWRSFISQSGETADTLASLRYCRKARGSRSAPSSMCRNSTIAREADVVLPTLAGPEIGVASTKAFTCQLVGAGLARRRAPAARAASISRRGEGAGARRFREVPRYASQALKLEAQIEKLARELAKRRATCSISAAAPTSRWRMEGALKLKEISYIHAEGYAAGELKHGPIALIDENMPVIVIAPA